MIKKTKEIKQVNIGYQLKNQAIKGGGAHKLLIYHKKQIR